MLSNRPKYSKRTIVAATLLIALWTDKGMGQESGGTSEQISQLVKELGASDFKTRTKATSSLREIGEPAIGPLKAALPNVGDNTRGRMESLLRRLEANTFQRRLDDLLKSPSPQTAERFSQWGRFAEIVGTDKDSIALFIRLVKSESELFSIADADVRNLRAPLLQRALELDAGNTQNRFSFDSFAALLLLASNNEISLRGATSYHISAMLKDDFAPALKDKDGPRYLKLIGAWMLRDNINAAGPLDFALAHPMPEGLVLARMTLKSVLRKPAAMNAMKLVRMQGDTSDIALLESLFNPQHPKYNERSARGIVFKARRTEPTKQYVCCYGDWALAVAISMRGRHPFDFGFTNDRSNAPPNEFAFTEGTTGFKTEDAREAAFLKYHAEFLAPKTDQQ